MLTRIKNYTFNLGAIAITLGASAIVSAPSFAQTTSIPITGGSFTVNVTNAATNNVTSTAVTVLTPVGTATVSALSGTTVGTTNLTTGNNFDIAGKSTGSVNFDTGKTATFTDANTTIKGKIVDSASTANISALTASETIKGSIQTGSSIDVLTSSISTLPTNNIVVPITGGSFDVIRFTDGTVSNTKTTVLTPFGTANLTSLTYATLDNLNGASIFKVGDDIRGAGKASGTVAVDTTKISKFTDANIATLGTVKTATDLGGASFNLKGDVTGGNLVVPSSSVTTLPPTSNLGSIILIVANPKLLKLVSSESKFTSLEKFKFLVVLSKNSELLSYTESKSTEVSNAETVSIGDSNVTDSVIFLSFKKIVLFPVSHEVSFKRPVLVVGKVSPGQLKKQRVVFVGMSSRLISGFGTVAKVEQDD
ncbi:hypothetical protein H6F42_07390 [Pseudanabaena sp. FACHB-1998]|uniref:hypothetical protein n=1 Tax=Pseudanabaena sp. FACHB-1998 TaxID=2692858 RepID=UPI001681768D|nr:hypothetical protein [Pseudanabaena sp. FACHB-1998]MBD2176736.1 hypothetical protein [Pseudanabaena sp. FACHB-1998]